MNRGINLKLCLVFVALIYATSGAMFGDVGAQQEDKPAEQVYKNIQVMKGVPASRLMPAMNRLTQFLGVD
jgi:hypothetical protein